MSTPALDWIERDMLSVAVDMIGREARLEVDVATGEPTSAACRHCSTGGAWRARELVRKGRTRVERWRRCPTCDATPSDLWVPEGWS